ncbi:hypothetical protein NADFUDRAFT_70253 [Nadsonia fulvescens var. elongata DSM 6958]|uniref:Uncharacterized protein n=1 Tax=Nadsonia fulvescens var. elongata DSM 6958 TaxID=857566 RepID=A0A1E3PKE8_9ASCO|nr:hypothetical protein NADFUDRAFT_70253 [Nadsonia fulvescens var. elongata DSM 6958]
MSLSGFPGCPIFVWTRALYRPAWQFTRLFAQMVFIRRIWDNISPSWLNSVTGTRFYLLLVILSSFVSPGQRTESFVRILISRSGLYYYPKTSPLPLPLYTCTLCAVTNVSTMANLWRYYPVSIYQPLPR